MGFKIKDTKEGYLIHTTENKFILCKIIDTYDNKNDAVKALVNILAQKK